MSNYIYFCTLLFDNFNTGHLVFVPHSDVRTDSEELDSRQLPHWEKSEKHL